MDDTFAAATKGRWFAGIRTLFARFRKEHPAQNDDLSPFLYQLDRVVGERYRTLAWMMDQLRQKQNYQVVVITSAVPSEGKSTLTVNLAAVLVERADYKVLLIDCDMRRPRLCDLLGAGQYSLQDLLEGRCEIEEAICYEKDVGVYYIPVTSPVDEPLRLLASSHGLQRVLAQVRQQFDYIILDSPPVLPVSDALFLTEVADAALFVVRAGETSGRMLSRAMSILRKEKLLGIVFNGTARGRGYGYDPYYRRYAEGREYSSHRRGYASSRESYQGGHSDRS